MPGGPRDERDRHDRPPGPLAHRVDQGADRLAARLPTASRPRHVLVVTALVGLVVTTALTLVSAEIYINVVDRDGIAGFDRPVLDQMVAWRTPALSALVRHVTDLGGTRFMPVIALASAGVLAWWWHRWTPLLLMAIAGGGSLAMTVVGKAAMDRARPPHWLAVPPFETSPSFPSGHSLNSWVVMGMIAYLVACRSRSRPLVVASCACALAFAVAIGFSRVYLGAHWLTDVLVAWTLGSAWLGAVVTGHRLALAVARSRGERPQHPTDEGA